MTIQRVGGLLGRVSRRILDFQFNSSTSAADPGSGYLSFNSATKASITALYISKTGRAGQPFGGQIETWDDSTSDVRGRLYVFATLSPTEYIDLAITDTGTDHSTYWEFPVSYVAGDNIPVNDATIAVDFSRTGDKGDSGLAGSATGYDYETRTAAMLATIPSGNTFLRTAGYYLKGDGGEALYVKGSGSGDFQSSDGAWWVRVAAGNVFNVRQYGAKGDGSTDDYASIAACYAACVAAGGGDMFFPRGTYRVVSKMTLSNTVTVRWLGEAGNGSGAPSKFSYQGSSTEFIEVSSGAGRPIFENLYFASTTSGKTAVKVYDTLPIFRCCQFTGANWQTGVDLSDAYGPIFEQCVFSVISGRAINAPSVSFGEFQNGVIRECGFYNVGNGSSLSAIYIKGVESGSIVNSEFAGNYRDITLEDCSSVQIRSCYMENHVGDIMSFAGSNQSIVISHCWFGNYDGATSTVATLDGCSYVTIEHNTFYSFTGKTIGFALGTGTNISVPAGSNRVMGPGTQSIPVGNAAGNVSVIDAVTNTYSVVDAKTHMSSGTAAAGFGLASDTKLQNASGSAVAAHRSIVAWTSATAGAETANQQFYLVSSGTLTLVASISQFGFVTATGGFIVSSGGRYASGQSASNTAYLSAWNTGSSAWKNFATLTSGATPTMVLDGDITTTTQTAGDSSTKIATTSFVTSAFRERLTAVRTYYVRTDGSDSNTGLANTAGGAFLTIQKAWDTIIALDMNGKTVTISVADGTYAAGINATVGNITGTISIVGNTGTLGNVICSAASGFIFAAACVVSISGFKCTGTSGAIYAHSGAVVTPTYIEYAGNVSGNAQLRAGSGGIIKPGTGCVISSGALRHFGAEIGGAIQMASITITVTGTPAFTGAFAYAATGGKISSFSVTFSGAATGKRYEVIANGSIYTFGGGASAFPGDVAGTDAGGGYA